MIQFITSLRNASAMHFLFITISVALLFLLYLIKWKVRISSDEIINLHCDIFSKKYEVFAVVRMILIVAGSSLRHDLCTV